MSNKKFQKSIISFLIILLIIPGILFSRPKKADAWVATWLTDIFTGSTSAHAAVQNGLTGSELSIAVKKAAEEILANIVRTIERRLLAEMTKSMVNWINSGFHGSPLFLQNPTAFFQEIGKYEIKNLVNIYGYDPNRFPFGESFALNTINSYKRCNKLLLLLLL